MEPTKAAFPEMASQAGLGGLAGVIGQAASVGHLGQGQGQGQAQSQVGPGVGALDEKIRRKRTESMGKGLPAPEETGKY
jgi:AMP deaminase